jgi:hypothetical protein
LITVISLFGLFLYIGREENNPEIEHIESNYAFPTKKKLTVGYTSSDGTASSESTNCAYKVNKKLLQDTIVFFFL